MASSFPLVVQSGKTKQLQSGDVLLLQSGGIQIGSGSFPIVLNDNTTDALSIAEGSNVYLDITTTDAAEAINIGNATINNALSFLGTGQVTFSGNVDATNGLDVTTAALTTSAGFTNSGGEALISGGNLQLNDSINLTLGTSDDLTLVHNGTNSVITNTTGLLQFTSTETNGSIEAKLGSSTVDAGFRVRNSGDAVLFQVNGDGRTQLAGAANYLSLEARTGDPTPVANNGAVYAKIVSAQTELFYSSIQLTDFANSRLNPAVIQAASSGFSVSGGALSMTGTNIDLDPTGLFTLDMDASQTATITLADNLANALLVQEGSNAYLDITTTDSSEHMEFGNATTNPTFDFLGTGAATFAGDVVVSGNLTVDGTTTTVDSETVNIADNHLYLNNGYTADAAQTGGLVVNYDPTTTTDTSSVAPPTSTTITTAGSGTFAANDYIQISGGGGNDGIYRVSTHTGTTLTIATTGDDFIQTSLDTGDATAMTLYKVSVSVLRAGTDGVWETGAGNTGPLSFSDLATASGVTLQQAYDNDADGGNVTVTMNSTDGKIIWAGDQDMQWTTSGTADFDSAINSSVGFTNSGGEMLFSGGNLQLNDSINLSLGTGDDLVLAHSGTASSITNATGALTIENNAAAANIIVELGDNAAATSFVLNDSDSAALLTIDSNGQADFTGNVDANAGLDVTGAALTAAAALTVTGGAFSFSGSNIDLDPTGTFTVDMDASQTATFTIADNLADSFLIKEGSNAYLDVTTTDSSEKMEFGNATTNPGYEFLGSGLVDIANGTLDIPAGTSLNIGGTTGSANLTGTNLNTLVDGGNADALHTHATVTSAQIVISGLDTATNSLANGDAGYISAADTMTKTDATAEASSRFFGFNEGTAGSMTVMGLVEAAKFTTDGGSPNNGAPVYLALGTADTSTGAGKLTATAPTTAGQFVAEVGLCLNNANYAGSKTAEVLIQPKAVVAL